MVFSHRRLKAGQALYRSGDAFGAVYLLRTGTIKTVVLHEDGREQVSGFYMSGEMFGLEAWLPASTRATQSHWRTAISASCLTTELETLSRETQAVQRHLYRTLASEVVRKQRMMLLLGSMRAGGARRQFLAQSFGAPDGPRLFGV